MMFSTKAEYGVRVMVELARSAGEDRCRWRRSPRKDGLPLAYLEHLVARLRKAGLVDSRRGSRGGYLLARPAREITMAEVVEALEGAIAPIECISEAPDGSIVCSREPGARPRLPDQAAVDAGARCRSCRRCEETTLADLIPADAPAIAPTRARIATERTDSAAEPESDPWQT